MWVAGGAADSEIRATSSSPPTTQVPEREPDWIAEGGVRFATTVLVPTGLADDDGAVRLRYELVPLGQRYSGFGETLPPALPERWELRLDDGRTLEAVTAPPSIDQFGSGREVPDGRLLASVVFEGEDATADQVDSIVVTGWRIAVPTVVDFVVSPEPGQQVELFDGSLVTLDILLEQRSTTIVGFSVDRPSDPWRTEIDRPFLDSVVFRGVGPGWTAASSTIGGTGGGGPSRGSIGFQLTWGGPEAPDPVEVRFATTSWLPVETAVIVPLGSG